MADIQTVYHMCLAMSSNLQDMFKNFGGEIRDGTQVVEIVPGEVIILRTKGNETIRSRRLILTAGAWTSKLIKPLGVHVPLQVVSRALSSQFVSMHPCICDFVILLFCTSNSRR